MNTFPLLPAAVLAAALAITGCSGKKETPEKSSTSGGNPITAPVDYLGAVAKAQHSSVNKLSLLGIQQAIQHYQAQEGHLPKDLQDLVKAQVIGQLPEAPQGMKFSYDARTGEVTVVPK